VNCASRSFTVCRVGEAAGATLVTRDETPVLFVRAVGGVGGARAAWDRLEATVGSLRGRQFFGAFDPGSSEYRACVQIVEEEDDLGLERGVLPGGSYLRARIRGAPPELYERIPTTFAVLAARADPDGTRPSLEYYRRYDEIDLLLPVISASA
jgi:hypothetical protein